ncbi:dnaJ homolog subfamily C member 2-like [Dermatophagoides pteronyssinus]|uniref:dnaJ homolog subfamily C member 2-like n=1 Tax=Dermatophagoides pteronyssinus TaxID=6956 RepID=UPI003F675BC0
MNSSKNNDANKSLVVYESHTVWMNNLLQKLGLIEITEQKTEDNDDNVINDVDVNGINDDDDDDNSDNGYDDDVSCDNYLKNLDPKEWKDQDHYRVLALSKKRINASESQIKKSYRRIVLRHHPDKQGQNIDLNCHYFSCITKAYEILSDPAKRRSYDSVDPTFDNTIPNPTTYNKNRFFDIFTPVFELNARWSLKKPVPLLGNQNSTYEEINDFYSFWYNFESWREYSYLDEEEKEKGENREERRYLDKQNKIARAQRKKEEMQRIRQLVDNAYQCDPRVSRFKEDEKKRRQEQKQAKQASIKARKEEEERIQREKEEQEMAEKKRKENEERQKRDEERKQKEMMKKKTKKEIKMLETFLEKENYFANDQSIKIEHMKECDKMTKLLTLEQIIEFRKHLESIDKREAKKNYFLLEIEKMNKKLEEERLELAKNNNNSALSGTGSTTGPTTTSTKKHWSYDDVQILIKAVKLFPAGTPNRWTVIANYINDKTDSNIVRNHRDVLEKAKDLQKSNEQQQDLKEEANKNAFKKLEIHATQNVNVAQESAPSQRYDAPSSILEVNDNPWTNEEQQLLEQAMKTYPSNLGTERWNLIAECIPNRSRADCIKRYKYLVELVKAKNLAKSKAKK